MANSSVLKIWEQLFFLSIATVFIASCTLSTNRAPASLPQESPPKGHVWQYLLSYGDEVHGYATYSYVLAGRDESNQHAALLYHELIKAIQGSTVGADIIPEDAPTDHFNLFLIPATDTTGVTSHKPNYELSKLLLSALSTSSSLKFSNPGPYIITLYQPISFGGRDDVADMLYIDLTNIHQDAIPEVVRTYKNEIIGENLNGIDKLRSLRLSVLNMALITGDCIGFAQAAYAELRSAFFKK